MSSVLRHYNETPADPNDDTVRFTLNVAGTAGEVSPAGWTISAPAPLAGTTGPYGVAKDIAGVPIAAFAGAGQTMVVVVADSENPAITASVTVFAPPPPLLRVNIDFNGKRPGDADSAGTYVGAGAAGGGPVFNGIIADSTGGDDNLTVSGFNLVSDTGAPTTVGFTTGPVAAIMSRPIPLNRRRSTTITSSTTPPATP